MVEEEQEFLDSEEDNIDLNALPAVLWHEGPLSSKPEDPPQEVDFVADDVEVQRLIKMGNLGQQPADQIKNVLTTKFVRDWRIKTYEEKEKRFEVKKWLRRSRLVGREFAFKEGKRFDRCI